ncbi:hypothetical protein DQ04_03041030 [Trypanosoma grayi]|uniref:hypothetical protein n=1 Tax=Trypanosoma grayi TaxID=71804 RepID=UPI0004F4968A|nr:hypothetical protein DQ04_03041030 [Trypanosoma grayi]KEG11032.1 hypothetical protein DQ04_03041030 [Trypanosoma grayi]
MMEGLVDEVGMPGSSSPQYAQIQWRLEVPLGCRRIPESTGMPHYTIALTTMDPISGTVQTTWMVCSYEKLVAVTRSVENALAALDSPQYRRLKRLVK